MTYGVRKVWHQLRRDLADAFMADLRDARVISPSPSTFERLCAAALVEAERGSSASISLGD